MLDLRNLQSFVVVAERLSVSKAAPLLHISQSALSRQIQGLEEALGVRLFDRIGKRLVLTAEGLDLLPRAAALLDQAQALSSRVHALARGEIGMLRIGATPQTIAGLLSSVLVSLRKKYPEIEISLVEGANDYLLEQLEIGGAHVAIAALPDHHEFESSELFMGNLFAIAPMSFDLPSTRTLDIKALAQYPLLLLRKGFMTRNIFDKACVRANVRPHSVLESDSTQTLRALARAGHGIAVVSSTAIWGDGQLERCRLIPLSANGSRLGQMISVAWNPRRYQSAALTPFLQELHAQVVTLPLEFVPHSLTR